MNAGFSTVSQYLLLRVENGGKGESACGIVVYVQIVSLVAMLCVRIFMY